MMSKESLKEHLRSTRSLSTFLYRGRARVNKGHTKEAYYPYFDYLRAVAALGVFFGHADAYQVLPKQFADACVQIFFALSGFLIGGILLRSKPEDMPRFYFNRATRIWIPYAIAIVLLTIATGVKQGFADPKTSEFLFYMVTFVYNWFGPQQLATLLHRMPLDGTGNHFWSICVEEQFYLLAPFVILLLPRAVLFPSIALAGFLAPHYFASIGLGLTLAVTGSRWWLVIVAALSGVGVGLLGSYIAACALLSTALVGALAVHGRQAEVGRIIGGASYPFYLNHWMGLFLFKYALKHETPYLIATLLVVHHSGFDSLEVVG